MTQTNITPQPADDRKGTVVVRDYPNVRIHTYVSPPDGFLVNTHLVEGEAALVLFDGQRAFGDLVAARPTIPTATLTVGKHTLAGVRFEFRELLNIESDVQLLALLPEQQVLLAFDLVFAPRDHAFTVAGHFDHWISVLDDLKGIQGYDTILIGHDLLTDQSGFDATMAYLRKAKECHAQADSGTSYAEALKAAFPERLQPGWVDFSGLVLFSTPRPQAGQEGK